MHAEEQLSTLSSGQDWALDGAADFTTAATALQKALALLPQESTLQGQAGDAASTGAAAISAVLQITVDGVAAMQSVVHDANVHREEVRAKLDALPEQPGWLASAVRGAEAGAVIVTGGLSIVVGETSLSWIGSHFAQQRAAAAQQQLTESKNTLNGLAIELTAAATIDQTPPNAPGGDTSTTGTSTGTSGSTVPTGRHSSGTSSSRSTISGSLTPAVVDGGSAGQTITPDPGMGTGAGGGLGTPTGTGSGTGSGTGTGLGAGGDLGAPTGTGSGAGTGTGLGAGGGSASGSGSSPWVAVDGSLHGTTGGTGSPGSTGAWPGGSSGGGSGGLSGSSSARGLSAAALGGSTLGSAALASGARGATGSVAGSVASVGSSGGLASGLGRASGAGGAGGAGGAAASSGSGGLSSGSTRGGAATTAEATGSQAAASGSRAGSPGMPGGGGGGSSKENKRRGLGGILAPTLEDEPEAKPLPASAGAGSR